MIWEEDRHCVGLWKEACKTAPQEPPYQRGAASAGLDDDPQCVASLCNGQVPLVTPERIITLLHAVERPLLPTRQETLGSGSGRPAWKASPPCPCMPS